MGKDIHQPGTQGMGLTRAKSWQFSGLPENNVWIWYSQKRNIWYFHWL